MAPPLRKLCGVSAGVLDRNPIVDLNYEEDKAVTVDFKSGRAETVISWKCKVPERKLLSRNHNWRDAGPQRKALLI